MADPVRTGEAKSVVGREEELARLDEFVREARPAIVLIGGAGVGKTTLWQATVESARGQAVRVLTARPSEGAAQFPFGGVIDLCGQLGTDDFVALPDPQRRTLEVALMRAEPAAEPVSSALIALGLLGVVRGLADRDPVLVAIDDLQWLDPQSIDSVMFVARRLEGARVSFLLARRPGGVGALEAMLARGAIERLRVGPLSLGAVRRMLFERLGLTIARPLLRRIVEVTEGNPLFALELGRSLMDGGETAFDSQLPLPESLEEMLGNRVAGFPLAIRRVLLAVALSEDPRIDQLLALVDAGALDDAVDAGAVVLDGTRVRAAHPLLAAAAERSAASA